MNIIGLAQHEQNEILRMLAVVLWLGNIQFTEMDDGNAQVDDTSVIDFIAYLMEADSSAVNKAMTTRVIETQRGGRRGTRASDNDGIHSSSMAVKDLSMTFP